MGLGLVETCKMQTLRTSAEPVVTQPASVHRAMTTAASIAKIESPVAVMTVLLSPLVLIHTVCPRKWPGHGHCTKSSIMLEPGLSLPPAAVLGGASRRRRRLFPDPRRGHPIGGKVTSSLEQADALSAGKRPAAPTCGATPPG